MGRIFAQGLFFLIVLFAIPAMGANESMQSFTLSGPVYQAGTTAPLLDSNLIIKVQVLNPAKTCVLYEEQQNFDTTITNGVFNIQVGSAYPNAKRTGSDPGNSMALIYQNMTAIPGTNATGQTCGGSYTPTAGATRYFRVIFTPSSTNTPDTMTPDIAMGSVPSALVAQSLQGLERGGVLQVRSDASYSLTQVNLENAFSAANYPRLSALLSGTSTQYMSAMPSASVSMNSQKMSNLSDPTSAQDAATKGYTDSYLGGKALDVSAVGAGMGSGRILMWDASLNKWMASTLTLDTGTTANKIVQLNGTGALPAVDGANLKNINAVNLQSRPVSSAAPSAGQVLGWNGSRWLPMTIDTSGSGTASSGFAFVNGGNEFGTAASLGTNDSYSLTLETAGAARVFIANNGKVGIGTVAPQAGLDIALTGSAGSAIIIPRDTNAARPVTPVNGMLRYNTSTNKFEGFQNGAWMNLIGEYSGTTGTGTQPSGTSAQELPDEVVMDGGNSFGKAAVIGTNDGYPLQLRARGTNIMTFAINGNVGIGTTSPQAALDIQGSGSTSSAILVPRDTTAARPTNIANGMIRYNTSLNKMEFVENGAWTSFSISSDERLKKNVETIENGLEMVEKIRPVYFDWDFSNPKAQGNADKHQVGFIAQELEKILPEVVNEGADTYRTVEYAKIVPVAIAAVKELNGQVKSLKQENEQLKAKLKAQEQDLAEIKKRLGLK